MRSTSKFRNVRTEVDGIIFDSKREASRYQELKLLMRAGEIKDLVADKKQLRWKLVVGGVNVATYEADFQYQERVGDNAWRLTVEDSKGFRTAVYRLKNKLMRGLFGIEIRET